MSEWLDKLTELRQQVLEKYSDRPKVRFLLLQFESDLSKMLEIYLHKIYNCEVLSFQATNFVELCLKYKPDILFVRLDKLRSEERPKMGFSEFMGKMRSNPTTKEISLFMFTSITDYGSWDDNNEYQFRKDDAYFQLPFVIADLEFRLNEALIWLASIKEG